MCASTHDLGLGRERRSRLNQELPESFLERVHKVELTGCWLWTGYVNKNSGYGMWSYWVGGNTRTEYAHRFAYTILVGPIPDGLVLDHRCYVKTCVNPDHLEAVTQKENLLRRRTGNGGAEFQRRKTHCAKGHPYSGENLTLLANGKRGCKACARERMREKRAEIPRQPRIYTKKDACKRGHEFTPENTYVIPATGQRTCRECKRDDVRRYRERNREVYRERDREAKRNKRTTTNP